MSPSVSESDKTRDGELIVGIGASALPPAASCFQDIFSVMPADSGMAFVLVQRLSPDHQSMLAEIL